jgi:hypothetical protein
MRLFCDGVISTIVDLTQQDSSLLDVVATENIDLSQKLHLAHTELLIELEACLERTKTNYWFGSALADLNIEHIVVTPPLKQWHTYRSLAVVYRDAYFTQLNARYEGKWRCFEELSRASFLRFTDVGIGLVSNPVRQARAPLLSLAPGGQPGGQFYLAVSHLNLANEEGSPSIVCDTVLADDVDLLLIPQNVPPNAVSWNFYAGTTPDQLVLQNGTPITGSQPYLWLTRLATGAAPGNGQHPNRLRPLPRIWQRG